MVSTSFFRMLATPSSSSSYSSTPDSHYDSISRNPTEHYLSRSPQLVLLPRGQKERSPPLPAQYYQQNNMKWSKYIKHPINIHLNLPITVQLHLIVHTAEEDEVPIFHLAEEITCAINLSWTERILQESLHCQLWSMKIA
mmetsp:Transcript_21354/g.23228  ORF Transcript_21354/g.23228 Transcript_21354/m.23228 type:complete len:140 (-) Transcript_21354:1208-1627(-)